MGPKPALPQNNRKGGNLEVTGLRSPCHVLAAHLTVFRLVRKLGQRNARQSPKSHFCQLVAKIGLQSRSPGWKAEPCSAHPREG